MLADSPHHYHVYSLFGLSEETIECPVGNQTETTQDGDNVIIFSGEKAICPTMLLLAPVILFCVILFSLLKEEALFSHLIKWYRRSRPQKIIYEFCLFVYNFLRPPPVAFI